MELRALRYFLAVAREKNITAAANHLHMTQPTLSRQIQNLEEELGQKLLKRGSHWVTLTAEGMLLRKRAEELVAMADKTEEEFRAMRGAGLMGDVWIGGGETGATDLVAALCRELREEYPGLRYHLFSGSAQEVAERLDRGLLDFGLLTQPADLVQYDRLSLPFRAAWGVFLRRDDPLARKPSLRAEDLAGQPLILSRQALEERAESNELARWFGPAWSGLNIVATFNLCCGAAAMARQGVGCVVGPDGLADTSGGSPLCFRPLAPRLESALDVVWKKFQVFSGAAELFLERLRRRFPEERPG